MFPVIQSKNLISVRRARCLGTLHQSSKAVDGSRNALCSHPVWLIFSLMLLSHSASESLPRWLLSPLTQPQQLRRLSCHLVRKDTLAPYASCHRPGLRAARLNTTQDILTMKITCCLSEIPVEQEGLYFYSSSWQRCLEPAMSPKRPGSHYKWNGCFGTISGCLGPFLLCFVNHTQI